MKTTCETCKFWQHNDHLADNDSRGCCHIRAPIVVPFVHGQLVTCWPDVVGTDWCGEWQPLPVTPEKEVTT